MFPWAPLVDKSSGHQVPRHSPLSESDQTGLDRIVHFGLLILHGSVFGFWFSKFFRFVFDLDGNLAVMILE